ncbi:MAG TPA: Rho termination factor N-terminal domain-containing protein, partial [Solirubrobacteraceae bacterium]|nr:Rho termination factor N-terminal domain-containing protein [Solirubrobacteraceae bacterium]
MSVISRSALESSTLADLHEIASELGLDGFRRLRKADLVAAIVERQGSNGDEAESAAGGDDAVATASDAAEADDKPARRSRRGGRGRGRARDRDQG